MELSLKWIASMIRRFSAPTLHILFLIEKDYLAGFVHPAKVIFGQIV
jgi:hypothetical protein